ncbi:MAG: hypothetical protein ABII08_03725 [Candidatus Beckwithbacteria bacterium]
MLSELYELFAEKFKTYADFWQDLAREEVGHAEWIRDLSNKIREGSISYNQESLMVAGISYFTDQIRESMQEVDNKDFELINAISISRILESSLLENKCFEIVRPDSVEIEDLFNRLKEATKKHLARVEEAWKEIRKAEGINDL